MAEWLEAVGKMNGMWEENHCLLSVQNIIAFRVKHRLQKKHFKKKETIRAS